METKRELLIERKSLKKNDGTYEFRISTRTRLMDEDNIATYDERKEILFIEFYNTPNKYPVVASYRKGADYTTTVAKNLMQNKKLIESILELYSLPKNSRNAFRVFKYLPSIDSSLGDLVTLLLIIKKEVFNMKEVFSVNMTKKKEFEEKELSSIRIEARISRRLEFNDAEEIFIGLNDENRAESLGTIFVERYDLNEDAKLCSKSYRIDAIPQYQSEQNFYKFINDRRVFERLMKEIAELMGRTDKDEASLEFGFRCDVSNIKAHLLQAMELEMDSKLKEFVKDRFFKKEEAIVRVYKGCDKDE